MPGNGLSLCVVLPAFQEEGRIGKVVEGIRKRCEHVVVVDDGSTDATAAEARGAGAVVISHERNRGKGAALNTGFFHAREHGFEAVVTMDADGQHDPADIPALVEEYRRSGAQVVIGNRMGDPRRMPLVRRLTNRYMSWLLSRRMGQRMPDTQCGFRLYKLSALPVAIPASSRFAAESEILLLLARRGTRMSSAPIRVIYGDEKSKIRPVRDTVRFVKMLLEFDRRTDAGAGGGPGA